MSGLFDDAADESDGRESGDDGEQARAAGGDAEQSGDDASERGEGNEQDSSEEEEDGDNEYDLTDKFIAREDEEEDGAADGEGEASGDGSGEEREARRRKRRRERSPELDEEDYQLLEENQVTGIRRKQKAARKRIRKQRDNANKTDAERLQEELFGTAEGVGLDDEEGEEAPARFQAPADEDLMGESDDEMAGFIDDGDEARRARRAGGRRRGADGVSSHGLQEMQEIFGDVDDLLEAYAEKKAALALREGGAGEEPALEAEVEGEDEDAEEQQEARRAARQQRRMEAAIEPELMQRLMIQPRDARIRAADAPERFQLSGEDALKGAYSEAQLEEAARWILEQLVPAAGLAGPGGAAQAGDGSRAAASRAADVLEGGICEVDGKPRDGRPRDPPEHWGRHELEEGATDLSRGLRGLKRERRGSERQAWRADAGAQEALVAAIVQVLREMWDSQHEVPVIACFRKHICGELLAMDIDDRPGITSEREARRRRESGQPLFPAGAVQAKHRSIRRWDVLWAVHELAGRWRGLQRRKERRLEAFRAALGRCEALAAAAGREPEPGLADAKAAVEACIKEAEEAGSMEELDDVDAKFKLAAAGQQLETAAAAEDGGSARRPQRASAYAALKRAGLDDLVRVLAMPAAELGDNLASGLKRNQPQDPRIMPVDLAYEFVREDDAAFDGPDKVLERARHVHVLEIAAEPRVRAFCRRQLERHMSFSTSPTAAGEGQLDAFHPYGGVKRLRGMPVAAFAGRDTYLRLHLAHQEGLIQRVDEVGDLEEMFVRPMLEFYESSAVSAVSKEWNTLRHAVLRDAVQRLVPQLQGEAAARLLAAARECVAQAWADRLWRFASAPPVQLKTEDGDVVERRRIAACCWGEGRPATCLVMLDECGALTDVLYLPCFSGPLRPPRLASEYAIAADPRKASDVARVVEFCRENRPQAILVGARNAHCKALREDVGRITDHILDAHAQILTSGHDTGTIEVAYADETLAELWAGCAAAKEEFPDHPDVVRRAVALGRLALEPLAVLAAVCGQEGREILSVSLHPLQQHVPQAELLRAAEVALLTAVPQVGADVNLMASNAWLAAMLPHVPGLGPRKARALLQAVQAHEFALTRVSLWNDVWRPGNAVFRNCGGFLRITAKARGLVNAEVEPLDAARVEPLNYGLAFAVARAAVGGGGGGEPGDSEEDALVAVHAAMAKPERVEALDLEALHGRLAAASEDPGAFNQISALVDTAMEFIAPAMELRVGNGLDAGDSKEQQFWWMCGESAATLKPGRRVEALVRFVGLAEARCSLPEIGDLDASLAAADISAKGAVTPADYLQVGQTVPARIKAVIPEEFRVELTTSSTDLNDEVRWEEKYCAADNPHFHVLSDSERKAAEDQRRRQSRPKALTKRTIDHPNFRNVSMNEAVRLLEAGADGEALFRPSSKGTHMVTLTIKLHGGAEEDVFLHRDVKEGRKRGGPLTLGTPLTLLVDGKAEQRFEDLDEILANFVEPLSERVQQVVKHRKFKEGSWEDLKEALQAQAAASPRAPACYCLGIDHLHPGFMYLGCVLPTARRTPRREHFSVSPAGFYFRKKVYTDLERMLGAFKRNPMGAQRAPPPPQPLGPPPLQSAGAPPPPFAAAPMPGFGYGPIGGGYGGMQPQPQPYNPAMMYQQQQQQQAGYRG